MLAHLLHIFINYLLENFNTVECAHYTEAEIHSWSMLHGPCKHPYIAYIAMLLSDGIIFLTVILDGVAFYLIIHYLNVCLKILQKKVF